MGIIEDVMGLENARKDIKLYKRGLSEVSKVSILEHGSLYKAKKKTYSDFIKFISDFIIIRLQETFTNKNSKYESIHP